MKAEKKIKKRDGDQIPNSEEPSKLVKQFDDQKANTLAADFLLHKMVPQQQQHTDLLQTSINLTKSGEGNRVSAKSKLQEICAAHKWKPPFFECSNQEGPPHCPLFTFKVTVEIGGENEMCLECFGTPRPKKITASEDAAQGALWYLNHSGYLSIGKFKKEGKTPRS